MPKRSEPSTQQHPPTSLIRQAVGQREELIVRDNHLPDGGDRRAMIASVILSHLTSTAELITALTTLINNASYKNDTTQKHLTEALEKITQINDITNLSKRGTAIRAFWGIDPRRYSSFWPSGLMVPRSEIDPEGKFKFTICCNINLATALITKRFAFDLAETADSKRADRRPPQTI